MKKNTAFLILLGCTIIATIAVWYPIMPIAAQKSQREFYFLDVGQGDSQVVVLRAGMQQVVFLIDAGPPGGAAAAALDTIFTNKRKRIDIAIMTHTDRDHYGGMRDLLRRYEIGLLITNGKPGDTEEWKAFASTVAKHMVPHIVLSEGDSVKFDEGLFSVLSPPSMQSSRSTNEGSLVLLFDDNVLRVLFTGDIDASTEHDIQRTHLVSADVLKVAHHGSKYSSSESFLDAVSPRIAIIQVGKNSYGHPTQEVLDRIQEREIQIYRTDKNGTVRITEIDQGMRMYTERAVR